MTKAALQAAEALHDVRGKAFALRQLAWVGRIQGASIAPTLARLAAAEQLATQAGDRAMLAEIWYVSSDLREQQGDLAGAEALAHQIIDVAERTGDERIHATGAYRLAKFALHRGDQAAAWRWLNIADTSARHLGWRRQLAWNSYRRGVTYLTSRNLSEAETALSHCLSEARVWDERRLQAYALQRLVEVYAATGRRTQALAVAEDVRERFERQGIDRHEFAQLVERLRGEDALLAELLSGSDSPA